MPDPYDFLPEDEPNDVQLIEASGEWLVRVVEAGHQLKLRSFDRKRLAIACAEEECRRLGLTKFTRI